MLTDGSWTLRRMIHLILGWEVDPEPFLKFVGFSDKIVFGFTFGCSNR